MRPRRGLSSSGGGREGADAASLSRLFCKCLERVEE